MNRVLDDIVVILTFFFISLWLFVLPLIGLYRLAGWLS